MRTQTRLRASLVLALASMVAIGTAAAQTGSGSGSAKPATTGTGTASGTAAASGTATPTTTGTGTASGTGTGAASGSDAAGAGSGSDAVDSEAIPVNIRLRRLEQRVEALKERAWRAKARVGMLKESVLGGGVGAQATLVHINKMGSSYRLTKLVYALDGSQIFSRADEGAQQLYKTKSFDILTGPIAPGSHTISVIAVYQGHGYGVFKYLDKYTFTVRSSHTFTAEEGKATRIEAVGFEKGGATTRLEDRPAIDFKVTAGTNADK